MSLAETYKDEIDAFFRGTLEKKLLDLDLSHGKRGHIWICSHGTFDTLTVEPPRKPGVEGAGGQYEIAVRFAHGPHNKEKDNLYRYSGYYAQEGWLVGKDTGGH